MLQTFSKFFQEEGSDLVEWAKCGDSCITVTPTLLWAVGAAALAQRLLSALFRRYIFRRVALWEQILQKLLFIWMVIYSLHFWVVVVKIVKVFVEYCYRNAFPSMRPQAPFTPEVMASQKVMQQWAIWVCGAVPLVAYIHTRSRREAPPLMIWITTNPWQRREMGPYGYYLNRPPSDLLQDSTGPEHATPPLRKAFSDSNILIKEPPKRKRHSKSI